MTATATTPRHVTHIPIGASLMALGSGVVWSFGAVTARKAEHADAFQYLIWRSVGVLVVMEVLTAIRHQPMLVPKAFTSGKWMLSAVFGLLLASFMFIYAVKTTTAANASFLGSVTPLAAVVLARVVLGERLSRVTLGAIVVAFVGLVVTVFGDLHAGNMLGNMAALTASVGFAIYTISVRSDPDRDWSPVLPGYAVAMIVLCSLITHRQRQDTAATCGGHGVRVGARSRLHRGRHQAVQPRIKARARRPDDRLRPDGDGVRAAVGVPGSQRIAESRHGRRRSDHLRRCRGQGNSRYLARRSAAHPRGLAASLQCSGGKRARK